MQIRQANAVILGAVIGILIGAAFTASVKEVRVDSARVDADVNKDGHPDLIVTTMGGRSYRLETEDAPDRWYYFTDRPIPTGAGGQPKDLTPPDPPSPTGSANRSAEGDLAQVGE